MPALVWGRGWDIVGGGTVIVTREGTVSDTGGCRFLVRGDLPNVQEIRVEGMRSGERSTPVSVEIPRKDTGKLCSLLAELAGDR